MGVKPPACRNVAPCDVLRRTNTSMKFAEHYAFLNKRIISFSHSDYKVQKSKVDPQVKPNRRRHQPPNVPFTVMIYICGKRKFAVADSYCKFSSRISREAALSAYIKDMGSK
jgi:hypothetical protein